MNLPRRSTGNDRRQPTRTRHAAPRRRRTNRVPSTCPHPAPSTVMATSTHHPSLIAEVRNNECHVLGGRDAADAAGLPSAPLTTTWTCTCVPPTSTNSRKLTSSASMPRQRTCTSTSPPRRLALHRRPALHTTPRRLARPGRPRRPRRTTRPRTAPPEPLVSGIPTIDLRAELLDRAHVQGIRRVRPKLARLWPIWEFRADRGDRSSHSPRRLRAWRTDQC